MALTCEELARTVDGRIEEIEHEMALLQAARSALVGETNYILRPKGGRTTGDRTRSAPDSATQHKSDLSPRASVLKALREGADRSPMIASKAGISQPRARSVLHKLHEEGLVERKGERGFTRWLPSVAA